MNGLWIYADEQPEVTKFYHFTKEFEAKKGWKLIINSCADSRYLLELNGHLIAEGPCQGSSYQRYYDKIDCSAYLKDGLNIITAKVLYLSERSFTSVFRLSHPALWVLCEMADDFGNDYSFRTDDTWQCVRDDSISFHNCKDVFVSVPQFEDMAAEKKMTQVTVRNMYETNLKKGCFNQYGLSEKYILEPRPIPQMETQAPQLLNVIRKGNGFIELDAGAYTTAKVHFTVKGDIGKQIKITYAECYLTPDADGNLYKDLRDNTENGILAGAFDTVMTNGNIQQFSPFWYRAFRFIRIDYDGDFELINATFEKYFYPMTISGSFISSDEKINQMWNICINTVRCCMHEIYVDCPYYEQQQYDMDSALESLFTYRFTNDTLMQKKCITDLAHSQLPNGFLRANYPAQDVQVIPNFSLFWIFMLRDYMEHTGNKDFVRSMTGTMDKILEGFRSNLDDRGLFGTTHYWHFIDWVPTWPDGTPTGGTEEPLTVSCLMYSAALRAAAYICRECGRDPLAVDYLNRSEAMNANVFKYCYDDKKKMFRNTPSRREFAEHTTLWAILSDAVTGEEAHELMLRTLTENVARCTFSMNHYMFRALEKSRCYSYADSVLDGWRKMLDMHCTSWCENPDAPRSECHGWSSAPAYEFSAIILGVKPEKCGYDSITIKPFTSTLDFAKGTVPTPHGIISVEWKKQNGKIVLDANVPDGIDTEVVIGDKTARFCNSAIHFEEYET